MIASAPGGENPSAAFLAGQQHGTQLAVQHHVTAATKPAAVKPVAPASPRKPAATTTTAPGVPTLNDILAQARAMASQDTSAQVNAIKQQQDLYNTQASDRAAQINLASQAAAKFLAGIGDNTASSYNTAAQTLAGLAQGYSGDLRNTADDAASQAQAQLASLGAPAGSLKTATGQTSQPEALGNVLYGLGGAIPANLLVTSGQAQAAAQRQLPASTLGYGQQQALGTIAAGQQQADQLTPQIVPAQGGQSKLAQQYLSSIQSQLASAQQQQTSNALAQSLIGSRTASTQIAKGNLTLAQDRLAQSQANSDRSYQLALTRLSTSDQPKASASLSKSLGYLADSAGNAILQDGKKVTLPKPAGVQKGPLGLSAKDYQTKTSLALGAARNYHSTWKDANGKDQPPLSWQQYLTHGESAGIPVAILIKQGIKVYSADERKLGLIPGG